MQQNIRRVQSCSPKEMQKNERAHASRTLGSIHAYHARCKRFSDSEASISELLSRSELIDQEQLMLSSFLSRPFLFFVRKIHPENNVSECSRSDVSRLLLTSASIINNKPNHRNIGFKQPSHHRNIGFKQSFQVLMIPIRKFCWHRARKVLNKE